MTMKVTLEVVSPAMSAPAGGMGVPMQDHQHTHTSVVSDNPHMPDIMRLHDIGDAHILTLGVKIGDKIMGCTYITEQYPIPGLGNIVQETIGVPRR